MAKKNKETKNAKILITALGFYDIFIKRLS